jgi:hypothetical protein
MTFKTEMQAFVNATATAYRAGDAQACPQMLVTDGVLYSPYAFPARGHAEIETQPAMEHLSVLWNYNPTANGWSGFAALTVTNHRFQPTEAVGKGVS